MPKGMKTAPPQQANLSELWGGKGKKKAKQEDASTSAQDALKSEEKDVTMEEAVIEPSEGVLIRVFSMSTADAVLREANIS